MLPCSNLWCGPAGWSYPQWHAIAHPGSRPRRTHPLEYLADFFDSVEIDSSFDKLLRPEVTRLWLKKVDGNPRFMFIARMHRALTQERVQDRQFISAFKEGIWPLLRSGKLGCILLQFPWSFRFTTENRAHLINLRRAFHEFPLVSEFRHSSWMIDEALGTLIDYRIGFCNFDQPQHTHAMPPTALLTSPIGYVRLNGRNSKTWLSAIRQPDEHGLPENYLYHRQELEEWKTRIEKVRRHADRVFVITNNRAYESSVVNALQLQAMHGGPAKAPASLLSMYPEQLAGFAADYPVQEELFCAGTGNRRVA